jgi:hypothetical protein
MLAGMSIHEFRRWRAYYDLEPFGEERADYRAASIVATLLNLYRKRGSKAIAISDVRLRFGDDAAPKRKSWQSLKAIGAMIAGAANRQTPKRSK